MILITPGVVVHAAPTACTQRIPLQADNQKIRNMLVIKRWVNMEHTNANLFLCIRVISKAFGGSLQAFSEHMTFGSVSITETVAPVLMVFERPKFALRNSFVHSPLTRIRRYRNSTVKSFFAKHIYSLAHTFQSTNSSDSQHTEIKCHCHLSQGVATATSLSGAFPAAYMYDQYMIHVEHRSSFCTGLVGRLHHHGRLFESAGSKY